MKKIALFTLTIFFYIVGIAQNGKTLNSETLLKEVSENACQCVDSIETFNLSKKEVAIKISDCIDKQTTSYQLTSKISNINELIDKKPKDSVSKEKPKEVNINININKDSREYKKYYREIESYMMDSCAVLKEKVASNDKMSPDSFSLNEKAIDYYTKGQEESKKKNYKKAVEFYKKAVKEDSIFTFAWDNLGLNYRRLNKYDLAIEAYEHSLKIDPNGLTPLQNIAVVYKYKKEYKKAIKAYKKLAKLDKKNPEVFYGIGLVYTYDLVNYEKALDNMCKAYNLYIEFKSPYRTDAEKVINVIYQEMKKQGKEAEFNQILKKNNISSGK